MIYFHVRRYARGIAEVTVYAPSAYLPRMRLATARQLLELWRAARKEGAVKLVLHK